MNIKELEIELKNKGFNTNIIEHGHHKGQLEVSLKNRQVSVMEVSQALFELHSYWHSHNVQKTYSGVVIVSERYQ